MPDARPVLIAAGGTGGHVYPALAVAEELRARGVPVVWLGTKNGVEARAVAAAGFDIEWVNVVGLRGKNLQQTLLAPLRLLGSCVQAWKIFKRRNPVAVLGMGGFVTAPGAMLAIVRRLPLILHEQNSVAGLTNRVFSRFAKTVFTAFPSLSGIKHQQHIGNPVRRSIEEAVRHSSGEGHEGRKDGLHLLVVGGSLGARILNQTMPKVCGRLGIAYQVWHQCGRNDLQATQQAYNSQTRSKTQIATQLESESKVADLSAAPSTVESAVTIRVEPFIDDMAQAYEWSDLVICRAGALTVAELSAAGVASVLVPYPHAVDDHQTGNARWLADAGAAVLLPQNEIKADTLAQLIEELAANPARMQAMSQAARELHLAGAAERVADELLEVAA